MSRMLSVEAFTAAMEAKGWVVFPEIIGPDLVERMRADIVACWDVCRTIQERNGVAADADLTVHHLVGQADSFLDLVERMAVLAKHFEAYFGGKYILNSLGGAVNTRGHVSYAQRVHRDIRSFSGDMPLLLNTLVMLDAFTPENGATHMGSGSHKRAEKPTDEAFYARAEQALGPAGSVLVFNSNLWHAGGENRTDRARRSVTPMFCRPFMKQQFDYPRALGYERPGLSEYARQVLGYNSRVPATLDEWYQPPDRRMYRPGQG
jgi:ectoine hydroxylase-related dioxygenase (phytanoyl-CoA dioxygenase family)